MTKCNVVSFWISKGHLVDQVFLNLVSLTPSLESRIPESEWTTGHSSIV